MLKVENFRYKWDFHAPTFASIFVNATRREINTCSLQRSEINSRIKSLTNKSVQIRKRRLCLTQFFFFTCFRNRAAAETRKSQSNLCVKRNTYGKRGTDQFKEPTAVKPHCTSSPVSTPLTSPSPRLDRAHQQWVNSEHLTRCIRTRPQLPERIKQARGLKVAVGRKTLLGPRSQQGTCTSRWYVKRKKIERGRETHYVKAIRDEKNSEAYRTWCFSFKTSSRTPGAKHLRACTV